MMSINWVAKNAHLINFDEDRSNEPEDKQCASCMIKAKQYCDECGGYGSDMDCDEYCYNANEGGGHGSTPEKNKEWICLNCRDDEVEICEYCEIYGEKTSECGTCLERYCPMCSSIESKLRSIETGIFICDICCAKEDEMECEGCGRNEIWDCSDRQMCKTCHFKKEDELYEEQREKKISSPKIKFIVRK